MADFKAYNKDNKTNAFNQAKNEAEEINPQEFNPKKNKVKETETVVVKPKAKVRKEQMSIVLPPNEKKIIRSLADDAGTSISELISFWIKQNNKK